MRNFTEEEIKKIEKIVDEAIDINDLLVYGKIFEKIKNFIKEEAIPYIFPSPPFPVKDVNAEIANRLKNIKEKIKEISLREIL